MNVIDRAKNMNKYRKIAMELSKMIYEAENKAKTVKVLVKGDMNVKSIEIDPEYVTEIRPELLQKTIREVVNMALNKAKIATQKETKKLAEEMGLNLPM
ncbi:MAG: YbaB/EbfC family nucleoid-associated protein [Caldisericia bacterium]|nr:YbaB/EbfC family nucleoid-associated protein [Caldisericia bacterium]